MNIEKEIRQLGIKPVEGQNFLSSEVIINALTQAGEVEDKKVLEIGAGTGAITEKLSEKAEKVIAVEKDTKLVNHLRERFDGRENVKVVEADIMDYKYPEVDRCVSNPPFFISSEIIEKLGVEQVQSSLILQEELVDRIIAEPGDSDYGRLSVMANFYFIPVKLRSVGREHYHPKPEVDTAILKLYPNKERHQVEDRELFFLVTKALFTHKRKKVRNAFVDARHILDMDKSNAKQIQDELPHSEERVINLDIRKLADISNYVKDKSEIS